MPGTLRNAVLGAVAATAIAGCGSDDGTIPPDNAEQLGDRLGAIESNVDQGECTSAIDHAEAFKDEVNLLPASVEDEVKQGLQGAAAQLVTLTANDCGPAPSTAETTDTTDTTEPETTETTTETTETTDTTETTEEPTTTVEPETTTPPEDEQVEPPVGNQGQGGSGGVGSDGGIGPGANGKDGGR